MEMNAPSDKSQKFRLAVVNSHPIQYFAPLYRHLNATDEFDITALYCSDFSLRGGIDPGFKQSVSWDVDLLSGYRAVFLGKRARRRSPKGFWSLICPELWGELRGEKYDAVVIHGNQYFAYVLAAIIAKLRGIPTLHRCETHLTLSHNSVRRKVRDRVLAIYYRMFNGFLAIGAANREYYEKAGVAAERIFEVPYTIDNERFSAAARISSSSERALIKRRYGLSDSLPTILFASKFMHRKHPDKVLKAASVLAREGLKFQVLMVGTGDMQDELKKLVTTLKLENVVFSGFVNQSELPKVFAATDIFVLPSENEPWGLIVNEVMCAGRPVIVGRDVGCVADLVKDGVNGILVRAGEIEDLANALRMLILDKPLRDAMGRASTEIIRNWDFEACYRGLLPVIDLIQGHQFSSNRGRDVDKVMTKKHLAEDERSG